MGDGEWLFGALIIFNSKWVNNMASLLAVYLQLSTYVCMYIYMYVDGLWICGIYVMLAIAFFAGYDSISEVEINHWVE